jgi:hypothetical protein
VTGSSDFHLEPGPAFQSSLLALEKATYNKHDKNGKAEFRDLLQKMFVDLLAWPQVAGCRNEPFPSNIGSSLTKVGWTFHKLEFSVPRAHGGARQGRLMLMVHLERRLIIPTQVYTHAQYAGRIPDADLRKILLEVKDTVDKRIQETGSPLLADPENEPG